MNELEWPKLDLTPSGGFKKGELVVIADYIPRRSGKSWVEMQLTKQRPAGKVGNYTFTTGAGFFIKYWPITKKMKSKSKQSRYVRVVMKGEWK